MIEDTETPGERFLNERPSPAVAEPSADPEIPAGDDAGENEAVAEAIQQQDEADASKTRLLDQLNKVRAAEQMQRQQFSRLRPPQTREELVAALMQQTGTTEAEANFLIDRPAILQMQNQRALAKAVSDIQAAAFKRGDSPEYFEAVEQAFAHRLERKQQKAARKAAKEPTPEFFTSAPPPPEPPATSGAMYSAPVSRQVDSGGGYMSSPNSVRLTHAEREAAAMSGISETEYARNLLLLRQRQARGETQR